MVGVYFVFCSYSFCPNQLKILVYENFLVCGVSKVI